MAFVQLERRTERLSKAFKGTQMQRDLDLVKICTPTANDFSKVKTSVNYFLWVCLSEFFADRTFDLTNDMLASYPTDIMALPNITPNGLILPKRENQLAYNLVHQFVAQSFEKLNLGPSINRIQYPINIRIQDGRPNPEVDSRQRASVKPHTDFWAGDPSSGILSFLSVLGSVKSAGIEFLKTEKFPLSYVRMLEDYNEGQSVADQSEHLCNLEEQKWFIVDPYVLHRTLKSAPGLRISIDFRFILNEKIESDSDEDELRAPFFVSYAKWREFGRSRFYFTEEKLEKFDMSKVQPYTRSYPVQLTTVEA